MSKENGCSGITFDLKQLQLAMHYSLHLLLMLLEKVFKMSKGRIILRTHSDLHIQCYVEENRLMMIDHPVTHLLKP